MHTLSISVILSNVKFTHKLCFFNVQNRKLIHAYVSDPLFVGGTLRRHRVSVLIGLWLCNTKLSVRLNKN